MFILLRSFASFELSKITQTVHKERHGALTIYLKTAPFLVFAVVLLSMLAGCAGGTAEAKADYRARKEIYVLISRSDYKGCRDYDFDERFPDLLPTKVKCACVVGREQPEDRMWANLLQRQETAFLGIMETCHARDEEVRVSSKPQRFRG